ncbi:aldo/keto reductase [Gallibacterium salpingitidis]|uniref:aldo/keto reductase n=1 Tax=Gallibacterium salpingitidis TaxID=505341 RepID=UPI000A478FF7|nr:aldo/keto reductase [Gallibacterium salpingitidis]
MQQEQTTSLNRRRFIQSTALLAMLAASPFSLAQSVLRRSSMALDDYITLGQSGLRVSPFALGTMTFGEDLGWGSSVKDSQTILDRYIELGGNFLDTANGYTKGHSEKIIGDHLASSPSKRQKMVIATKFGTNLSPGNPNGGGASRRAIIAACDESLHRLRTDYIDLYWMHHWDKNTPIKETMNVLNDLVKQGKVRYLGVSDTPAWKATQAQMIARQNHWAPFIATQIEYSLAERTVEGELIPMAQELGMAVMPWAPLAAGRISGKYTRDNLKTVSGGRAALMAPRMTEKHFAIVDALAAIAKELNSTIPRVALAWVQNRPGVQTTIIGARTLAHLEDNVQALSLQLDDQHIQQLDKLTEPTLPFPIAFLRGNATSLHQGGATVNGVPSQIHPYGPRDAQDHY